MASFYVLRECNAALPSIYTTTSLTPGISGFLGQVVQIAGYPDNCWIVIQQTASAVAQAVTILGNYPDCQTCQTAGPPAPIIYKLSDCNDLLPDLYTNDLLTPGIATNAGGVVYIVEYPETCWSVEASLTGSPVTFTLITAYQQCAECIAAIPEPPINLYKLTDCTDVDNIIYTFTNSILDVLGKVINIEGYPGICWGASLDVYDDQVTQDVVILVNDRGVEQIFDDCECCLPPVPPEPVKYTRVIPKPDRHFYQVTQSQCDIQANIRFADAYYRLFKNLKYGINSQCDTVSLEKVWIKKQLSNLAVINDPTACVIKTPVTPVVCPEPSGNPFVPPSFSFTVGNETGTLNCTQCLDGTNPGPLGLCPQFNITLDYDLLATIDPDATYLFSYNGGCVITLGSFVSAGISPGYSTYAMTASNIVNTGVESPDPCASCPG